MKCKCQKTNRQNKKQTKSTTELQKTDMSETKLFEPDDTHAEVIVPSHGATEWRMEHAQLRENRQPNMLTIVAVRNNNTLCSELEKISSFNYMDTNSVYTNYLKKR